MKHELMQIGDLLITHGDIEERDFAERIPFYVSRVGTDDFASGSMPSCAVVKSFGFSEAELFNIERIVRNNMLLAYDYLRGNGAWA